ncbi:hypothetical protein E4T56_gene11812 [Termitomyces sp. T112]|nr:hypothetical protein E4T56_gene11812 [Termitomyces sp. T112]
MMIWPRSRVRITARHPASNDQIPTPNVCFRNCLDTQLQTKYGRRKCGCCHLDPGVPLVSTQRFSPMLSSELC